ncbi:MAG: hypothetical protein NVS9B15_20720 [Acidobacteriaceae bacterium]
MRMPSLLLLLTLLLPQTQAADLTSALTGSWAGYLEYRDYSEPPTSPKRVQLPTWLTVTPSPAGLTLHYIYDDGPNKVVEDVETVTIDSIAKTYTVKQPAHPAQTFRIDGLDRLHDGHGQLVLTGQGTDNDQPADLRETLTLRRNLIELLRESRAVGSNGPFVFRHMYRFTRSSAPK